MNHAELAKLVNDYVAGNLSQEEHQRLQQQLKSDPQARAVFREFMDLESGLHTWATEDVSEPRRTVQSQTTNGAGYASAPCCREARISESPRETTSSIQLPQLRSPLEHEGPQRLGRHRSTLVSFAIAASIALFAALGWFWWPRPEPAHRIAARPASVVVDPPSQVGTVLQRSDSVWSTSPNELASRRFSTGMLALASGVAQLRFDSGTDIVIEGPCELDIDSDDSAKLLAGRVVVNVTELSDGFTLNTPEASIVDEGTEYAVSLNDDAVEVHVFDGSVFWEPITAAEDITIERIEAGEARRYSRPEPSIGSKIPLGLRKFVRRLEAAERETAGAHLLAYDGFENLAGRLRRGRSGFGWSGGWQSGFRGAGKLATVVEASPGTVFGIDRTGRRLLRLAGGEAMRRDLEQALPLELGKAYYLSFLLQRAAGTNNSERSFQVSLSSDEKHRGRRSRHEVAFGISSAGFPFSKSGGKVTQSAPPIEDEEVYFCVAKALVSGHQRVDTFFRVYQPGERIDLSEPTVWTTAGRAGNAVPSLVRVRLMVGGKAVYDVDELKIGSTWQSVTASTGKLE